MSKQTNYIFSLRQIMCHSIDHSINQLNQSKQIYLAPKNVRESNVQRYISIHRFIAVLVLAVWQ